LGHTPEYVQVPHDYEADPVSIILTLDLATGLWHLFEGTFKIKERSFKIVTAITAYPCNKKDFDRVPDAVLRIAISCAKARGVGLYMP